MAQQQETRFQCDRCNVDISVPMNDQPALERGKPPKDWLVMWIDSNTAPACHLCPSCSGMFRDLMSELKARPAS